MTSPPDEPDRRLSESAKHDKSWGPQLKELAKALSKGDKSVLVALLQTTNDEARVALTSRGSPNDWFWAHLANVGLMEEYEEGVPEELRDITVAYTITANGYRMLPGLLPSLF